MLKITIKLDVFIFNPTTSELSNYFHPHKTAKSLIVILKLEFDVHVLKLKHIFRYHEKLMRLKKRNVGFKRFKASLFRNIDELLN